MVTAECGDNFCDPDENCESCSEDCLCTFEDSERLECCAGLDCKECEEGYCEKRKCNSIKAYVSMFEDVKCHDDGSISMEVDFNVFSFRYENINSEYHVKVFMKPDNESSTFKEMNGEWYPQVIKNIARFKSDPGVFSKGGYYWVRIESKVGFSSSIYTQHKIWCYEIAEEEVNTKNTTEVNQEENLPQEEIVLEEETPEKDISQEKEGFFKKYKPYFITVFYLVLFILFIKWFVRILKD